MSSDSAYWFKDINTDGALPFLFDPPTPLPQVPEESEVDLECDEIFIKEDVDPLIPDYDAPGFLSVSFLFDARSMEDDFTRRVAAAPEDMRIRRIYDGLLRASADKLRAAFVPGTHTDSSLVASLLLAGDCTVATWSSGAQRYVVRGHATHPIAELPSSWLQRLVAIKVPVTQLTDTVTIAIQSGDIAFGKCLMSCLFQRQLHQGSSEIPVVIKDLSPLALSWLFDFFYKRSTKPFFTLCACDIKCQCCDMTCDHRTGCKCSLTFIQVQ